MSKWPRVNSSVPGILDHGEPLPRPSGVGVVWIDVTDILRGSDEDHMRVLADIHKSQAKK